MRSLLWFVICGAIAFALTGCDDLTTEHVLEIHCVPDTGFNGDKLCLKPDRPGAELEIRINTNTQKVQILITKNDGNWLIKNFILDHCSVVDTRNWKCSDTTGEPSGPIYMVRDYGMIEGRFYTSLTGGGGGDYYRSSISGLTFWALHIGLIDLPTAMTRTGYSAQAMRMFGKL